MWPVGFGDGTLKDKYKYSGVSRVHRHTLHMELKRWAEELTIVVPIYSAEPGHVIMMAKGS